MLGLGLVELRVAALLRLCWLGLRLLVVGVRGLALQGWLLLLLLKGCFLRRVRCRLLVGLLLLLRLLRVKLWTRGLWNRRLLLLVRVVERCLIGGWWR